MAGVVAIAAVAVTVGVLAATNLGSLNSAPAASATGGVVAPIASGPITATPTPVVTPLVSAPVPPTADPTPPAPVPPAEQWRTFTSPGGKVTFEYPAAWSTASPQGAGGDPAVDVDVSDEAGIVVASLHLGPAGGFGGACQGAVPYAVLDTAEVDLPYQPSKGSVTPRFAFRALQESDRVTASYGLTSTPAGQGGTTCMFYNMVNGPAETPTYTFADAFQVRAGDPEEIPGRKGAKAFPSMDAARAYMGTSEYLNAKRMISSLKISAG
ncbi:hypothetical protein BJG92_03329 [Arthrobacter sp. SO5]|uniref:hypothetical protein n=1 Tax=Arthrobacter sp. SO5 TaxID=1897055 RepID=UPI001E45BB49|nr:hypothetical protein [Arthrobacter sp. SO5]MCB5275776.1 hypothetical protein [Arthrobacter sp. SO5]